MQRQEGESTEIVVNLEFPFQFVIYYTNKFMHMKKKEILMTYLMFLYSVVNSFFGV